MPSSVIGPRSRGAFALPASLLRERITAMRSAGSRWWSQWASSFPPTTSRNGRRGWAPWLPIRKRRGLTGIKMQRDPTFLGGHLNCPRCGLSIPMRPHRAAIRHCPRCVARSRVIVELFCSTSPVGVLDDGVSLPIVDGDAPLTRGTPATNEASYTEARHQQAHAVDKFGRARPLTLVAKRPMAVSLSAIGERAASPRPRTRLATCPSCSPAGRAGRADPEAGEPARGYGNPAKTPRHGRRSCVLRPPRTSPTHVPNATTSAENDRRPFRHGWRRARAGDGARFTLQSALCSACYIDPSRGDNPCRLVICVVASPRRFGGPQQAGRRARKCSVRGRSR